MPGQDCTHTQKEGQMQTQQEGQMQTQQEGQMQTQQEDRMQTQQEDIPFYLKRLRKKEYPLIAVIDLNYLIQFTDAESSIPDICVS